MQATILNIAKSRSDGLVSEAESVDCFYPAIPLGDPGDGPPATLNPPPDLEKQFALVESPAVESGLRLLPAKILTAAVFFAPRFLHLLAILFDLEIRLFNWLTRPAHEHSFRQNELPAGKHGMSNVQVGYQRPAAKRSTEFIHVAFGI